MRRLVVALALLVGLFGPLTSAARPSDRFWDPYRGVAAETTDTLTTLLRSLASSVEALAGRVVSAFRLPNPRTVGSRPRTAYHPAFRGVKTLQGLSVPVPPSPRVDAASAGTPCGGETGDPYWAADCSCRCSRGGVPSLAYEISDRCPDDDNRTCEDCRAITRHDRFVTTVAECLAQAGSDPGGGKPENRHFGL